MDNDLVMKLATILFVQLGLVGSRDIGDIYVLGYR